MRKREMTQEQLRERAIIVDTLTTAGWKGTVFNLLFERGKPVKYEASMEYQGKRMNLTLNYEAKIHVVVLGIYERSGRGIDLVIHFDDKLEKLLSTIISFQDAISATNYKESIRQIMKVCPSVDAVLLEQGEQIVPIIDKDEEADQRKSK